MPSPVVQVRMPEDLLAAIDGHRGDVTRSAWIVAACEAALNPAMAPVSHDRIRRTLKPAAPASHPVTVIDESGRTGIVLSASPADRGRTICAHPKARVIKGLCGACGTGGLG